MKRRFPTKGAAILIPVFGAEGRVPGTVSGTFVNNHLPASKHGKTHTISPPYKQPSQVANH